MSDKKTKLKGSKTEKNLILAFAGESQARNKYTFFASQAKKDGYELISKIFLETAENEKEHAKIWFKYLNGNVISTTENNLLKSANGENNEWTNMYKEFAKIAKEEKFFDIAEKFEQVANIEAEHEKEFLRLLDLLKTNSFFINNQIVAWKCMNCGHIHFGKKVPDVCPVCNHSKSYFKRI